MARKRDPRRDQAKEIWLRSNGKKILKDLANELNVSDSQIRKWKSIDKWSA
ncbi:small subunit of terminase, partial [Enterococcus faecalis]